MKEMRSTVIKKIIEKKIIAIIRGVEEKKTLALAEALYKGGIELIEVTFNQRGDFPATADAIAAISRHFGGRVLAGAGTVTTPELVQMAATAGAKYIISPNTDLAVIETTRKLGLVSIPGALTPTEILGAHNSGADFVKVFPASNFGSGYIKALKTPLSQVKLMAVGGINQINIREYFDAGCVGAGVGGNLVNKKWIEAGEYDKITDLAKAFLLEIGRQ